jgi:PAS domain S-box-containing protein
VFAANRPDVKYGWVFWSFATFIMVCGMTHVMSIWTLWVPDYGWEGIVKAVTAAASISTAIALWPLLPKVLAYPTPAQFSKMGYVLARTEQELGLLIDGVTDYAIFMLDKSGRVTNWNVGAQRTMGYRREEILGQHFSRFYTSEGQRDHVPDHVLRVATEKGRYEDEAFHVRKDGSRFWANVVVDAVHDETGKLIGFAKITRDITERRESEERLRTAREQLFQSQKMEAVGQLTGGVAHDFNNLLTIIIGNLETAQRATQQWQDNAKQRIERAVKSALTGAKRASTLTQRLLAFSRRQPLAPKPLKLMTVLSSMGA